MIQVLELSNFTVFKKARFQFGANLNVFVGENGSGKTHILKGLYAMSNILHELRKKNISQFKHNYYTPSALENLKSFYSVFNVSEIGDLLNWDSVPRNKKVTGSFAELSQPETLKKLFLDAIRASFQMRISDGRHSCNCEMSFSIENATFTNMESEQGKPYPVDTLPKCVFFPSRELLTIFPHYLALRREFILPYDSTYDDTIGKLGLPPKNGKSAMLQDIIASLETAIHGTVFLKNEKFYYHGKDMPAGLSWEIDMIAEGWRKLGMLLQLIQDGSLREGAVLLWDEPEANLNPRLIQLIASVIVELSKLGVQVFLTTHSLFLVNELEILLARQKIQDGVQFFNLQKGKAPRQGSTFSALKNVLLLDEEMKQSDRYMEEV